ncbi:MAG: spherulation-specific family 4 protein [Caldilineaceae bacterium]
MLIVIGCNLRLPNNAAAHTTADPKVQILLPLYRYPEWWDSAAYIWDDVAAANARVPITVIINPNDGPDGGPPLDDFVRGMSDLRAGGVRMIGYIPTNYGARDINAVMADVDLYDTHFAAHGVTGIFFDEVTDSADKLAYYEQLYTYVKAKANLDEVFLNPGAPFDEGYLTRPAGDTVVLFEDAGSNWPTYEADAFVANYPATRFVALIHGTSTDFALIRSYVDLAVGRNIGYLYITDDGLPNPWDSLPSFWDDLLAYLQQLNQVSPTATATGTPTVVVTATQSPTLTPSPTPSLTSSPTPSTTPTASPTPTGSSTPTWTPTATTTTMPPVGNSGDDYEEDERCDQSSTITIDGNSQAHTFHQAGDVDWVRFAGSAGVDYRVEVRTAATSRADVELEVYNDCAAPLIDSWHATFSPDVRLDFTPTSNGSIYLRLTNYNATDFGPNVTYELTVRTLSAPSTNKALILVAGRLYGNDRLQSNIHYVTDAAYRLFQRNDYGDDDIYYLATDSRRPGFDAALTHESLQKAITVWAEGQLQPNGVLTLFMVDHGSPGLLYLDEVSGQRVAPSELNAWLTELESAVTGLKVNVIIEACQSGSFIGNPAGVSKVGRVVITSTNAREDARASRAGAYFSDHLITQLHQGYNLAAGFNEAQRVARAVFALQEALLDANGDGKPNEFEDALLASQRSFAYAGTLVTNQWPPHIFRVTAPDTIANFSGVIRADVRDDLQVSQVWAVVYPPDYTPPAAAQELQAEVLPRFDLTSTGNDNEFAGLYTGFTQNGVYRIIVNAADSDGLVAPPRTVEVKIGEELYLPLVIQ